MTAKDTLKAQKQARDERMETKLFMNPMPILNYLIDKKRRMKR